MGLHWHSAEYVQVRAFVAVKIIPLSSLLIKVQ